MVQNSASKIVSWHSKTVSCLEAGAKVLINLGDFVRYLQPSMVQQRCVDRPATWAQKEELQQQRPEGRLFGERLRLILGWRWAGGGGGGHARGVYGRTAQQGRRRQCSGLASQGRKLVLCGGVLTTESNTMKYWLSDHASQRIYK